MLGTPGDFPVAGKVTKGAPRAVPFGIPRCGITALFGAALTLAPGLPSATKIDRFATLSRWANRSLFFPLVPSREHPLLSIRGTAGALPPRMPQDFLPATNTARVEGRGIKGGYAPFAGGPGTRRSLAYLCLLSLREKVGRGAEHGKAMLMRSARTGEQEPSLTTCSRGAAPLAKKPGIPAGDQ